MVVLRFGPNDLIPLDDYPWPPGLTELEFNRWIGTLKGIPSGLIRLEVHASPSNILEHLPTGLQELWVTQASNKIDLAPAFEAAYCDVLRCFISNVLNEESLDLRQACNVPLNKRPARVVLVVLSSSSVPRVGMRSAVRRLHRADLVREMAGMLDEVYDPPIWSSSSSSDDDDDDDYEYEELEEDAVG